MAKRLALLIGLVAVATASMAASGGNHEYSWQLTPTGSSARLRGLSVVSQDVV